MDGRYCFPVFKTGVHTDAAGNERTWTAGDLDRIASAYDPSGHEAPVVIGHPKENSPAFGWVKGLIRKGAMLYADAELLPEFEEMIKKGLFRKRSISLYQDGTLRHIGFLGAAPPAIKGLPDIRFKEEEGIFIEFTDSNISENRREGRQGGRPMKFMEWIRQLAGKEGVVIDDLPSISFGEEERKRQVEVEEEKKRLEVQFAEGHKAKEEALRSREEKIESREREARKAGITAFCETLQQEGRLTPSMMGAGVGMTNFLESIASLDRAIEFAEGDKKVRQTPLEFMEAFLKGLPKFIEFSEVARNDKDAGSGSAEKREKLISNYMEANPKATYREAILSISKENPVLFEER
ncbi:MAG TPA: hypothetical protein VGJ94_07210 [Syntrophorhabdaceae bacterium]|jgi:hypothetical protein